MFYVLFMLLTLPIVLLVRSDFGKEVVEPRLPRKPRWLNRLWAMWGSYFWLPCPICGRKFGGHESREGYLMIDWYDGKSVCWRCVDEAKELNRQYIAENPPPVRYFHIDPDGPMGSRYPFDASLEDLR